MPTHATDLELLLLTLLEDSERYGLELAKELRHLTGGDLDLNAGTLYPTLHRMEKCGWLVSHTRPSARGGHPLRYYRLTSSGQQTLNTKRDAYHRTHAGLTARWGNK